MKKRQISVWVEEDVAERITTLAKQEQISVSQFGGELLKRGLTGYADNIGWDFVGVRVEDAVKKEVGLMSDRLAQLLVRATLEGTATRALLVNDMMAACANDDQREAVKRASSQAWTTAVDRMRKPVQGLREILEGV